MPFHERPIYNHDLRRAPKQLVSPDLVARANAKRIGIEVSDMLVGQKADFFRRTVDYLEVVSDVFTNTLADKIQNDPDYKDKDPRGVIWDVLQERQHLRPVLTVMDYSVVRSVLEKFELINPYNEQDNLQPTKTEAFLKFELPKVLSQWWNKGEADWGRRGVNLDSMVIQWGVYYRKIMPTVWRMIPAHKRIGRYKVDIHRLNPRESHKSHEFYNIYYLRSEETVQIRRPETVGPTSMRVAYEQALRQRIAKKR